MSAPLTLLAGAALGVAAGSLLVPLTRRELAASIVRARSAERTGPALDQSAAPDQPLAVVVLAAVSGLLPAYVLYRVGWSPNAIPPSLLLDRSRPVGVLRPETQASAQDAGLRAERRRHRQWHGHRHSHRRDESGSSQAALGGVISFALFFIVNLMNPRWMAFGDVRLSLVFGFGLAWVSPDRPLRGVLLRQCAGALRRIGAHREPAGRPSLRAPLRCLHGTGGGTRPDHLGAHQAGSGPRQGQTTLTFCASSPLRPVPMVNSTVEPGAMPWRASPSTCEWWTKRSSPPLCSTKP